MPVLSAMPSCRHLHLRGPSGGVSPDRAAGPRADLEVCRAHPAVSPVRNIRPAGCGAEPFTAVGLGGCMLPAAVSAGRALHGYVMTDGKLHADDTPVRY